MPVGHFARPSNVFGRAGSSHGRVGWQYFAPDIGPSSVVNRGRAALGNLRAAAEPIGVEQRVKTRPFVVITREQRLEGKAGSLRIGKFFARED